MLFRSQVASCKPAWTSTPYIGSTSWTNATHAHAASNSGGTVSANAVSGSTLKSCVVTSSLTTVGALGCGSISSGFGNIDNGTSNITTGGTTTIDVDAAGTDGTGLSAAGTLRFGASQDLRIFHGGTHNYITGVTGDLVITTDGSCAAGIILDTEDDTLEIKYSGAAGANFGTGGLNLVSGDVFSIACTEVLSGSALASAVKLNNANWSGTDLSVGNGGTGVSTFTANGILVGNAASAVAVTATMATTGHLMVGDGSGVPSMLAVGTNDHVLTADSGEATGIKWAQVSGLTAASIMAYGQLAISSH